MGNRDTAIGDRYWQDTFYDPVAIPARGVGKEGGPDEPPKFKSYPGRVPRPLPQRLPLRLGPVDHAVAGTSRPLRSAPVDDPETLGSLLYFGYGLSRVDVGPVSGWPFHRLVPSARCFYPTELYVVMGPVGDLPAGVHHYDQAHHGLVELRGGDHRAHLTSCLGREGRTAPLLIVLSSHFWKTAFRYRDYAYRLCAQEAGMVLGNLLLVAGALGLSTRVHYQFFDEAVDHLLGLPDGEERVLAVVAIGGDAELPPLRSGSGPDELMGRLPGVSAVARTVPGDRGLASAVYEVDGNSVLREAAEIDVTWSGGPVAPLHPRLRADGELTDALRARHSGGTLFRPAGRVVTAADFEALLCHAGHLHESDLGPGPRSRVHVLVQAVEGLEPGIYRMEPTGMVRTGDLPPGRLAAHIQNGPPVVDLTRTAALCYVVVDRIGAVDALGNRGYRIANLDAGIVAQRLCVLAARADGLAARPFNGYGTGAVQRLLGLGDTGPTPLFQIALGHRTPSAQYEMSIVF